MTSERTLHCVRSSLSRDGGEGKRGKRGHRDGRKGRWSWTLVPDCHGDAQRRHVHSSIKTRWCRIAMSATSSIDDCPNYERCRHIANNSSPVSRFANNSPRSSVRVCLLFRSSLEERLPFPPRSPHLVQRPLGRLYLFDLAATLDK